MKKSVLAILILVVMGLFAFADYYVNLPGGIGSPVPELQSGTGGTPEVSELPNVTKDLIDQAGLAGTMTIEKRTRSAELFEIFDLSDLTDAGIYKNIVIRTDTAGKLPVYIYEIHGPAYQGSVTYLNIKLAMIAQLGSAAGINETGDFGYNSLFYNDEKYPNIGFLLSQVGDVVFGFKYSKDSQEDFDFVRTMINNYMSQLSNNS